MVYANPVPFFIRDVSIHRNDLPEGLIQPILTEPGDGSRSVFCMCIFVLWERFFTLTDSENDLLIICWPRKIILK